MAIKGSYDWRGINLPEAYVRVGNINGNTREGFGVEFCIYSSEEFASDPQNLFKMLQGRAMPVMVDDPSQIYSEAYKQLKLMPEFSQFVDC